MLPRKFDPLNDTEYPVARCYRVVAQVPGGVQVSAPTGPVDPTRRTVPLPMIPGAACVNVYATQNLFDTLGTLIESRRDAFYYHSTQPSGVPLDDDVDDFMLGASLNGEEP